MIEWLKPDRCLPPHRVTHPERLQELIADLREYGWRADRPALLGYWIAGRVQLISGSHRWAACSRLQLRIPIFLKPYEQVSKLWGTDDWVSFVKNPPLAGHRIKHYLLIDNRLYDTTNYNDWKEIDVSAEL